MFYRWEHERPVTAAASERLTALGETEKVDKIASDLAKQAAGQELTKAEQKTIADSQYGQRVANELNTGNIRAGQTSSD